MVYSRCRYGFYVFRTVKAADGRNFVDLLYSKSFIFLALPLIIVVRAGPTNFATDISVFLKINFLIDLFILGLWLLMIGYLRFNHFSVLDKLYEAVYTATICTRSRLFCIFCLAARKRAQWNRLDSSFDPAKIHLCAQEGSLN